MSARYLTISWDRLHHDARTLAGKLRGRGPLEGAWRGIVGVSRGGLIPAAILARELPVRLVETVSVAAYDEETLGMPVLLKPPAAAGNGAGFLVVDDLVDTGTTLRTVRALLPHAHFACLYAKPAGSDLVDSFVSPIAQDVWLVFPWDTPVPEE